MRSGTLGKARQPFGASGLFRVDFRREEQAEMPVSRLLAAQDALTLADVSDARPDGEESREDAGINRRKHCHPQHHPADGEHLRHRGDLARPVRGEPDMAVMIP